MDIARDTIKYVLESKEKFNQNHCLYNKELIEAIKNLNKLNPSAIEHARRFCLLSESDHSLSYKG